MPFGINITYFWLIIAVILAILEISTTALVCIWFVAGSLFAFAASFITDSIMVQSAVFVAVSAISLIFTRPIAIKHLNKKTTPTNSDMLIGKKCIVTEDISPQHKGRVSVDGLSWMARCDIPVKKGEEVQILKITGVTLTVSPVTVKNS